MGFCIAHVEGWRERDRVGYIVTLDVAPAERRRGLARRLMEEIETQARAARCGLLLLHVSAENEGAVRFYERMGFVRTHVAGGFYGGERDAFVYRRALGASPASSSDSKCETE